MTATSEDSPIPHIKNGNDATAYACQQLNRLKRTRTAIDNTVLTADQAKLFQKLLVQWGSVLGTLSALRATHLLPPDAYEALRQEANEVMTSRIQRVNC